MFPSDTTFNHVSWIFAKLLGSYSWEQRWMLYDAIRRSDEGVVVVVVMNSSSRNTSIWKRNVITKFIFKDKEWIQTAHYYQFDWIHPDVLKFNIKITNSLRLTHHVLLCARIYVSVLSDHHQLAPQLSIQHWFLHSYRTTSQHEPSQEPHKHHQNLTSEGTYFDLLRSIFKLY